MKQRECFYGYKAHVSLNADSELITSLAVSSGEAYDGQYFTALAEHDLAQQLPVQTYTADKGYDDGELHDYLETHGLHSAIRLKKTRTMKKDANKQVRLELAQPPSIRKG